MNIADMDERQLEEKKQCDLLAGKLISVIELLGMKPHKSNDNEITCYWRASERTEPDENGLSLHFSQGYGSQKNRIFVSAGYPRTAKGEYVRPTNYNEPMKDRISVSADKTPQQIAKDIANRLLPICKEYLAKVKKQINSTNEYYATTESALETLKGAKLDEYEIRSKEIRLNTKGYCHAKASRNEITLTLDSLDLQTAQKIIALLPKEEEETI
jgi:hypothetical protein